MLSQQEIQAILENRFQSLNFPNTPRELYLPIEYILSLGGKRVRPSLTLMACNLFSDDVENAIYPAMALEIFHNFTLVHDDIMDNAPVRRGHPTIHEKWDKNTAILSGDAMCIKAYEILAKSKMKNTSGAFELFNATALEVCEGQQLDMNFETTEDVSETDYLRMIELKTSVLLAACLKMGCLAADGPDSDATLLYGCGKNIGLAFQLQDDLLDVYGDPKVFGKKIGGDIIAGKKTFLYINALEKCTAKEKEGLKRLMGDHLCPPGEKVEAVTSIFNRLGVKEGTIKKIEHYHANSIEYLNKVSVKDKRKSLLQGALAQLMKREK